MQYQPALHTTWLDAYTVRRHPPVNLRPDQSALFSHEFQKDFGAVNLHRVSGATVTADGFILKGGEVLPLNHIARSHRTEFGWRYHLGQVLRKQRIRLDPACRYALCFDYWSNVYFHWICDALPRFIHMQSENPDVIFLVPEALYKGYVKESLELLGITRLFLIPPDVNFVVPELLVLDHLAPTGNFHPETMLKLRERMLSALPVKNAASRGIYSSRAKAQNKFVVNEAEVVDTLKEFQIDTCYFENMTFTEQLTAMQSSPMLVGLHGANLTNMLFMPGKALVLEFREHGNKKNNCFYSLADALGHEYYCQLCERGERIYEHPNRFDLVVDTTELRANLDRISAHLRATPES